MPLVDSLEHSKSLQATSFRKKKWLSKTEQKSFGVVDYNTGEQNPIHQFHTQKHVIFSKSYNKHPITCAMKK